jgi:hypothetical protein
MMVLHRNSLATGRSKVNMPRMTDVQISAPIGTLVPCFHQAIPAYVLRPGSVRTASAYFVTNEQHSCVSVTATQYEWSL